MIGFLVAHTHTYIQELMLGGAISYPAIFLIVIGGLLFIIGFCGCFGALLEIFVLLVIVSLSVTLNTANLLLWLRLVTQFYHTHTHTLSLSLSLSHTRTHTLQYSVLLSLVVLIEIGLVIFIVVQQDQVCP